MTIADAIFWIFIISLLVFNTRVQESLKRFVVFFLEILLGERKK